MYTAALGAAYMSTTISNYDGSIQTTPQQVVYPQTVAEIQEVMRDTARYPSPVRAMGSYHSLTPCASSDGTVVRLSQMTKVVAIDKVNNSFTAQGGLEMVDASHALRGQGLQFMLNIEIGNMTLGSAACCHTKDALDGIEFGIVSSYVTGMKWVTPAGDLAEATEASNPDLLRKMRSSHGLCGIIYEVTFRVKPIEALHLTYNPRPVDELTEAEVDQILDTSEGLICWTVGRTSVFQRREKVQQAGILGSLEAATRRELWNYAGAHAARLVSEFVTNQSVRDAVQNGLFDIAKFLYSTLHLVGGITILAPDKTIDYRQTPADAKYAFTFWAFPRSQWLATLRAYLDFADDHFKKTGFRCNMPLGAYHIRKDQSSMLSYTWDEEMFSIDPIHASTDQSAWPAFLQSFNEFASERGGVPLLNQSAFVERKHMETAFGQRWFDFCDWVREMDPHARMMNPFFAGLMSAKKAAAG